MAKLIRVLFENIAVSAAQDLISVKAVKPLQLVRYWVGSTDTTIPTSQMLNLRAKTATATLTLASVGGASATPFCPDITNSSAVSATAFVNGTTPATTSGAFTTIDDQGAHIYNGYDSAIQGVPPLDIPLNGGFVLSLLSTVSGTVHLSGGADFMEIG